MCDSVLSTGILNNIGRRCRPLLLAPPPSSFPVNWAIKRRLHGNEPRVVWKGQHPWLHSWWKLLPTMTGFCSNTKWIHHFKCDNKNINCMRVQWMVPCHQFDEVAGHPSRAMELLAPHFNTDSYLPYTEQWFVHQPLVYRKYLNTIAASVGCPLPLVSHSARDEEYRRSPGYCSQVRTALFF